MLKKKNKQNQGMDNTEKNGRIREILRYLVIGFSTTFINWGVTVIFTELIRVPGSVSSIIAWIVSTLFFAFWAYKFFVFRSRSMKKTILYPEFISFTAARLLTLGIEFLIMLLFVDIIGLDDRMAIKFFREVDGEETKQILRFTIGERYIIKLFACVIVTIVNYIFSKLVIFKKGQYSDTGDIEAREKAEASVSAAEEDGTAVNGGNE